MKFGKNNEKKVLKSEANSAKSDSLCLVFRTDLKSEEDVEGVADKLNGMQSLLDWSVDLDDRENVLRIECKGITSHEIIEILQKEGVHAENLP